jgi:isopropylmalate/homocitrate/citramalate synthase
MASGMKGLFAGYHLQSEEERAIAQLTLQKIGIVTHEAITPAEAQWLAERIGTDRRLTPNERALMSFIRAESPAIDPALQALVDRATVPA